MLVKKLFYSLLSFLLILIVWHLLTFRFSPVIVPPISNVLDALKSIFSTYNMLNMIWITIQRLIIGLFFGILIGLISGMLMGWFKPIKYILSPIMSLLQTIPPVTWVILALVWFGFNGRPAIFILILSTLPIVALSIIEGVNNIDPKLLEMAQIYHFSKRKSIRYVIIPSIMSYFKAALKIVIGQGWKIAVMAEVLTTSDGIGGMIRLARVNVQTEYVIAWAIIIVVLYYITDMIVNKLLFKGESKNVNG